MADLNLKPNISHGSRLETLGENHWRFDCPGGKAGQYRLVQVDDYHELRRSRFPWRAPSQLRLEARASENHLPGTWGFGFWNDPFGMGLGYGGLRLLPALPDAAWFFFASEPNYLSFRDHLPAVGNLAAVFRSPALPTWLLAPLAVAAPLLLVGWFSRLARRVAAVLVQEDAGQIALDVTSWHTYEILWQESLVQFLVDGELVRHTPLSPRGPLGLVLWLDNQFAAWTPDGRLKYGTLETSPRWMEIRNLTVT